MRMNNLTKYVMATLVAAFSLHTTPASAQNFSFPSEGKDNEKASPYEGLSLRALVSYKAMLADDLSRASLLDAGGGFSYHFGVPLSLDVEGGAITLLKGGMASHYTQRTDSRMTGYLSFGFSYLPLLSQHVALRIHPKGIVLFGGGGGAMIDIGSVFYIGQSKSFQLELGSSWGYLNWGDPVGDSPTAPGLEDPVLQGPTFGLYAGMAYKLF